MEQQPIVDACIVLAGGTAARLGGVSKPDYFVAGRRLLDILLKEIYEVGGAKNCIVVAPESVTVPQGVRRVLEVPPFGGPLAGIGAALENLFELSGDALVALCTCDAPLSPLLWERLLPVFDGGLAKTFDCGDTDSCKVPTDSFASASALPLPVPLAGAVPVTLSERNGVSTRRFHYLLGVYRLSALRALNFQRGAAVRSEFCKLAVQSVVDTDNYTLDVDTTADAQQLAAKIV